MPLMAKKRTGSRHKDRHNVSFPHVLYAAMHELAGSRQRPLRWEFMLAVRKYLEDNGVSVPTGWEPWLASDQL